MKLHNIKNVKGLFEVIDKCKDKVELVGDDIRINLKSKLSQYFALAELFSNGEIGGLELQAYCQDDVNLLLSFMMGGNV